MCVLLLAGGHGESDEWRHLRRVVASVRRPAPDHHRLNRTRARL